jgi:hypothetical protein
MTALIQKLDNFRSCDSLLSNLHFDGLIASAAAISTYLQKRGDLFAGLQAFALTTLADRAIKWIYTGDYKIPVKSDEKLISGMIPGVASAGLEEFVYSYVLLHQDKSLYFTAPRCLVSFFLGMTASRSLRHANNGQDLWDAAIGLGWAAGREIIVRNASPQMALSFSALSNCLIFGLIDRMKLTGSLRSYKFAASMAFRGILTFYALVPKPNIVPPLVAHALFNISRCLPG